MKTKYKLIMCAFLAIVGSYAALLLVNMINDTLLYRRIQTGLLDLPALIGNVAASERAGMLFLALEGAVALGCIAYFMCSQKPYQAKTYKVTENIEIPIPYGQGQHGTAWFMSDKDKGKKFPNVEINDSDPTVQKLLKLGKQRYNAVETGEIFDAASSVSKSLFREGGIVVGRQAGELSERLSCITDDVHTLTIGATRCGKTRCLVLQSICTLALAGEGIVINDPKGELYHYTRPFLESLGYTVKVVDFQSPKKSDKYNPLQLIIDAINDGRNDDAQTYAWDLVEFLVERNEHSEPIWTNGEMSVVAAAILCVVYDNKQSPQYQTLSNVFHFISKMCKSVNKQMPITAYMNKLPDSHPGKALFSIAEIAPDRMGGSFYTSALTTLRLFITNDVYRVTYCSEFSLDDVGTKPKQALFFILPDQKATYYPIVTLLVSQQYEQLVTYAKTHGNRLPHRVNFVLDEFGNFTAIKDFSVKLTVGGGYGVRWNLFLQGFDQLVQKYDKETSSIIKGNCAYWIYLQSGDNETNEEISKRLGTYTTSSYSLGGSIQKYSTPSSSTNIQLSQRNLLNPDEISKVERPNQLVISSLPPAVMVSPDISQWRYNVMLGLGDKSHNTRLIELSEASRPIRDGQVIEQQIWKPWEECTQPVAEEVPPIPAALFRKGV